MYAFHVMFISVNAEHLTFVKLCQAHTVMVNLISATKHFHIYVFSSWSLTPMMNVIVTCSLHVM